MLHPSSAMYCILCSDGAGVSGCPQDVKALVAACLAQVLRLHVAECPYDAAQQKVLPVPAPTLRRTLLQAFVKARLGAACMRVHRPARCGPKPP